MMTKATTLAKLRERPVAPGQHLIDGSWTDSVDGSTKEVISPIDGEVLTRIATGGEKEIDLAVRAARRSFESGAWSLMSPARRKNVLTRLADLIDLHKEELAVLGVRDNGTEFKMALKAEPGSAAGSFRYYGEAVDKIYGQIAPTAEESIGLISREPVGVVGAIVPWNFPLMIAAWKIAPALAAGNSVVLKPAQSASLSLLQLARLAMEAGIPKGVLNVVTGSGSVVGEALGVHPDVDVLAFTGSGVVGRRLLNYAAQSNLKRVHLELGGKSPNIVFADAPEIDAAVDTAINGIFRNSGQVCTAGSRLLVQETIYEEFLEKVISGAEQLVIGDPLDLATDIGAVHTLDQLKNNLAYVETAIAEGAVLRTGGKRIHESSGGYYMEPTIFSEVRPEMRIAQEEVFGPVLAVTSFKNEQEAIELANSTSYGLAAAVWTGDLSRAHRMIRRIKAGLIHVNCYGGSDITVPLGGMKQSGSGHDKSLLALDKYTEIKTAWISLNEGTN
jgi:gamma-glutamyl-gamma-aminobutyraldehyde dehydrogenase